MELGREMRTGLGKWAEAMRNIRTEAEVREGERDYWPEDMDWDAVGGGIMRNGRYREDFFFRIKMR